MKLILTSKQTVTLSNFCNDVAKGLFLASFLGQGVSENTTFWAKVIISVTYLLISLLILALALLLDRRIKNK